MKVKNLINMAMAEAFTASAKGFNDSAAGTVLGRQLERVDPKIFEKKYPALTFMNSGITIDNTGAYGS